MIKYEGKLVAIQKAFIVKVVELRFSVTDVEVGPEEWIDRNSEHVFHHPGNEPRQYGGAQFEAGVGIDLDEIGLELVVDYEVKAEEFEAKVLLGRVNPAVGRFHGLQRYQPHLFVEVGHSPGLSGKASV